jgi:CRP-like cAMP-binding protein
MEQLELTDGTPVFRPGERSSHAYRVESGAVEILIGDPPVSLTTYGPGEVFGEIGLLEGRLRRYGARAAGPTRLQKLSLEEWSASSLATPDAVLGYLRSLFQRVREIDERLIQLPPDAEHVRAGTPKLRLVPASPEAEKTLPGGELRIRTFPFRIGRASHGSESEQASLPDLVIHDRAPHNVSRRHLSIEVVAGQVIAADLGSSLGTQVNGVKVGGHHKESEIALQPGRNEIVLGGSRSPHRFLLFVESD